MAIRRLAQLVPSSGVPGAQCRFHPPTASLVQERRRASRGSSQVPVLPAPPGAPAGGRRHAPDAPGGTSQCRRAVPPLRHDVALHCDLQGPVWERRVTGRPGTLSCDPDALTPPTALAAAPAADHTRVQLPYEPQSARAARHLVRSALRQWGLADLLDSAELIVSELVGNAVKTGCRQHMTVAIHRTAEASVRISVRDGSRAMPVLIQDRSRDDAEGGRGLALVNHLTHGHWAAELLPLGKVIHADLSSFGHLQG
ncbi:ATP-binding protein [Kitasatospora sp. RB6PN24]|uniref:ATP-binding protein n=1 Tax=Kitasatospora humi TaxID=2893891 RepID=UPI001E5D25C3|nr:ATP-binding protein [Kitasatospora humi]MCC9310474.1 ATP-binding protein [Kitasatospora humi]